MTHNTHTSAYKYVTLISSDPTSCFIQARALFKARGPAVKAP